MNTATNINRETWLLQLAVPMVAAIKAAGFTVNPFRVSVGFPKGGKGGRGKTIGQCWPSVASGDKTREIFIHPELETPLAVATTLLHELCHAAQDDGVGHKGGFVVLCKALGFMKPWTQTPANGELTQLIGKWLDQLPPYPHARLVAQGISKQSTRLMKCVCGECGYTVRTTRKWIDVGMPGCPDHGTMDLA